MFKYETDPKKIRQKSFEIIRKQVSLERLNKDEQQIALCMMSACGDKNLYENLRFSKNFTKMGIEVLDEDYELLCDTEIINAAVKQDELPHEPVCLINKASVISQAKASKKTRSMIAVDQWKNYLAGSIVLIGSESTALLRLMELLEKMNDDDKKPALIIATPVGFACAVKAKQYFWDHHKNLGIPCLTLLGERGGSTLAATAMNTLLNMKQGKYF